MSVVKTLISPSRKFNAISLITTVYHVINKEVADSKPYVIKVALDHFILLTGIFGTKSSWLSINSSSLDKKNK